MSINTEEIHSYSHLFVVTLVFSTLATESFLLYSFLRESSLMPYEPEIVYVTISMIFSGLGRRISKVNRGGAWIFGVSVLSSASYYELFVATTLLGDLIPRIFSYVFISFFFGFAMWDILPDAWSDLTRRKIAKKNVVIIFGTGVLVILAIFLAFVYSTTIVSFFDSHPWAMTLIGIFVTLFGGILIGRRSKKS